MGDTAINLDWRYGVLIVVLLGAAVAINRIVGLGSAGRVVTGGVRAVIQLGIVSLVIVWVLRQWWSTAAFLVLMMLVGAATSSGRIEGTWRRWYLTLIPITCGIAPTVTLILLSGAVPMRPISVLPVCGILIGSAMTSTTLAGRRMREELHDRRGEVEAGLSIGLPDRHAIALVAKPASALALIPALDQMRTVGLVTLPGAFIGLLLGGAPPLQAGAGQLLVLVGIQLVQAISVSVTVAVVARLGLPASH